MADDEDRCAVASIDEMPKSNQHQQGEHKLCYRKKDQREEEETKRRKRRREFSPKASDNNGRNNFGVSDFLGRI